MINFNVEVKAPAHLDADMVYTHASMKEGETKFDMMARYADFHREAWKIPADVELVVSAKSTMRSVEG